MRALAAAGLGGEEGPLAELGAEVAELGADEGAAETAFTPRAGVGILTGGADSLPPSGGVEARGGEAETGSLGVLALGADEAVD